MIDFEIVAPLELQSGGGSVVGVWHLVCNRRLSLQFPKGRLVWSWMFRLYSCSMTLVAVLLVGLLSQLTKSKWFCQLRRIHELTSQLIFSDIFCLVSICACSFVRLRFWSLQVFCTTPYWAKDMEKHRNMRIDCRRLAVWLHEVHMLIPPSALWYDKSNLGIGK